MKLVAVQTEVRQETDEDGDLFARWDMPVVRAGKTMYHRTLTYAENGQWRHIAGVFAAADLATWPVRKVLAIRKLAKLGKPRVLSPTVWTMKKIGKLAL